MSPAAGKAKSVRRGVPSAIGMPIVARIATATNSRPATNFAPSTTHALIGCVNRVSSVPSLCSSANRRIVAAGTNRARSQGRERRSGSRSVVKRGLSEASNVSNVDLKKP